METTQNTELRQLTNSVEIVGTLKSKDMKVRKSGAGNEYMSGSLVVLSEFDGKVHEQKLKIFIMKKAKLFKGAETVMNEYKTIEEHGKEAADRVRITGELDLNEYYNNQGNLVSFNETKGVFFNRLDDTNDQPDKAIASIEVVVEGFVEELDKDQLPTGRFNVNGFTVAWGNKVIPLRKCVIAEELAQPFSDLYQPGSTGRLTFKLNNYVEVVEKEEVQVPSHGFGSTETVEVSTFNNYTNNIEIIGGDMPYFGTKEYTPEEIENAKRVRELTLQELQKPASDTPQNTGFGQGAPNHNSAPSQSDIDDSMPTGMGDEDMPDF